MKKPVGFDQKVLLHHLDFTANHTKKYSRSEMYELLDGYLRNDITGAKSRKNAITMLMKIWYLVDIEMLPVRDKMLDILASLTKEERLLVHWGMTLAAYPFFKDLAQEFGKLFRLQDEVQSVVIGKRMKEAYGDRRRVEVATSAVLMSMKSWGSIVPDKHRSYRLQPKIHLENADLQAFIVQILLHVLENTSLQLDIIQNHSLFFPFTYELNVLELRQKSELVFYRQGIDTLVVERV
ncbi:hypothetical protein [Peribacillus frigoritolerans]|uniref:hypothetical protein n=1 Tax=Peribacillus frigoritolerans TaxID=450367 RepID=UPI00343B60D3